MNKILNKVPAVTLIFWIVKILATTVGETAADFLSETLHLGLVGTSYVMGAVLLIVLFVQFKYKKNLQTTMSYTHALETTLFVKKYFDSKKCS